MYANRDPLASAACSRVDEAEHSPRTRRDRARARRACRRRPSRPRRRPRRRRAPTRRPGSGSGAPSSRSAASATLQRLFLRARAPPSSAAAASIFAGRSSGAALPISFDAAFCRARKPSTSLRARDCGLVERRAPRRSSPSRTRLRSMPRRYSGSSRSRLRSITRPVPGSGRAATSTHVDACFHAAARGPAPLDAGLDRSADRIRTEELHLALLRRQVAQRVGHHLVGDVALDSR